MSERDKTCHVVAAAKNSWISQVEAILSDPGTGIGMASHPCIIVSQVLVSAFSAHAGRRKRRVEGNGRAVGENEIV